MSAFQTQPSEEVSWLHRKSLFNLNISLILEGVSSTCRASQLKSYCHFRQHGSSLCRTISSVAGWLTLWAATHYIPGAPTHIDHQKYLCIFPTSPWCSGALWLRATQLEDVAPPLNQLHRTKMAWHSTSRKRVSLSASRSAQSRSFVPSVLLLSQLLSLLFSPSFTSPPWPSMEESAERTVDHHNRDSFLWLWIEESRAYDVKSLNSDISKWKRFPFR